MTRKELELECKNLKDEVEKYKSELEKKDKEIDNIYKNNAASNRHREIWDTFEKVEKDIRKLEKRVDLLLSILHDEHPEKVPLGI